MNHTPLIHRRRLLQATGGLAASIVLPRAHAQAGLDLKGPVRLIVAFPAGSPTDVVVRAHGEELAKMISQPIVVDNKPGASYVIALQSLLSSPADGHTLLFIGLNMVAGQLVLKRYDMARQLAPITVAGETPVAMCVNAKSPYKTLRELVEAARANPGKVSFGSPGIGSTEHIKLGQMEQALGVKFLHVPYRGGPDIVKAMLGGELDSGLLLTAAAADFVAKGMLRNLAVFDPTRLKEYPDVPALSETGLPITPMRLWGGYAAHAATPPAMVQAWHAVLQKVVTAPAVANRLSPFGMAPYASKSPEDFRKQIDSDMRWMGDIVKGLNLETN
jgi:tripartite-type tricarboxylate transporter receptor subunit TctC